MVKTYFSTELLSFCDELGEEFSYVDSVFDPLNGDFIDGCFMRVDIENFKEARKMVMLFGAVVFFLATLIFCFCKKKKHFDFFNDF